MGKEIKLVDAIKDKDYFVVNISESLDQKILNRLEEFGIRKYSVVRVLHLSKFASGGIVHVLGSNVCLDSRILSNVRVCEL